MNVKTTSACSILIVEDDPSTRHALVTILKHIGHQVTAAETVSDGLAQLDGQTFVVLDLNLPDGVGTTILQRIRAERRAMKVAVATGADEGELLAEARRLGPDLLLRKPYNVNELLKWLDTVG